MPRKSRVRDALICLAGGFCVLATAAQVQATSLSRDWPYVGQNLSNTGNQKTENRIKTDNADELEEVWRFTAESGPGGTGISGQPTIGGGVAYFADASGMIYAVDAETGALVWQRYIRGAQFVTSPTLTRHFLYIAESEDLAALTLTAPAQSPSDKRLSGNSML